MSEITACVLAAIAMAMFACWMAAIECHSKYSGMSPEFGFFSGCQITVEGKRIPADSWRNL